MSGGDFGGNEQVMLKGNGPGRQASAGVPFGRAGVTAFGGRPVQAWAGHTGRYELRRFGPRGALQLIVRLDSPGHPVTPQDIDAYFSGMEEAMTRFGAPPEAIEAQLAAARSARPPIRFPGSAPCT
jgi:hypothetical protein